MIGNRIPLLLPLIVLFLAANSLAITLTASVDKQEVGLGDRITLRINVIAQGGNISEPTLPDLSAFAVYSGSRSQNITINNGAVMTSLNITYILVPQKPGEFIIGPIVVRDQAGMSPTEPIKITVKPQQSSGSVSQTPSAQTQEKRAEPPQKGGDFFIDQFVDKSSPYVGEQVTLTFRFYQALDLWGQPTLEWPKYAGFTIEDIQPASPYYQIVNGRRYIVTEIKRALFPISSGKVKIDSPQLTIKPDDFGRAFDPFSFFDRNMRDLFKRGEPKILTSDPIYVNIKPLPENGRPADFNGAVGNYTMRMSTDKVSVGVDEPITMTVVLSGSGNIRSLPALTFPELSDFRVYDSGGTESVSNSGEQISGAKTYERAIIPRTSGVFTIPPLTFSYFDPSSGAYKTLSTKALKITATGEGLSDVGGAPKNVIGSGKLSLGYIITDFPQNRTRTDIAGSFWFWFLQVFPLAGLITAIVYRIKIQKLLGDQGYARRVGAGKRLKSIFKTAVSLKAKGDIAGFYGALYDAVLGYVADRLNLSRAGLTLDDVKANEAISENIKSEIISFLETCQTARFAPRGLETNHADNLLAQATELVDHLEKSV